MKSDKIYSLLLVVSIICFVGTLTTNIQQAIQFSHHQKQEEKYNKEVEDYEDMKLLYDIGYIDYEPTRPVSYHNFGIETPYNCLSIPVSIIFWTLALFSAITFIITYSTKWSLPIGKKVRLYIFSGLALLSTLVGVLYWAIYFIH